MTIHLCSDTIYQQFCSEYTSDGYYRLNYNVPNTSVLLTHPEGATPFTSFLTEAKFTIVGTSNFLFLASQFTRDGKSFSSQGAFGLLDSYDDVDYNFVGGLPTDTLDCYPLLFSSHFWRTGYMNFGIRFYEGGTQHLTTFQAHDFDDFGGSYSSNELFPIPIFEEGTQEYSGRIAGEFHDLWRFVNNAGSVSNGDKFYLGDADGESILAYIFTDGENDDEGMAVRYQ